MVEQEKIRVSEDEYMEHYAHDFYEWVDGELINLREGNSDMSPISLPHDSLQDYLRDWLKIYLQMNPIGRVVGSPFSMRLHKISYREPDLQVILKTNPGQLTETGMIGAADICIEIVSPESVERDYVDKLREYEKGGVREYWIFDLKRKDSQFYRLNEDNTYTHILPDAEGNYSTPLLPRFKLHLPTLWADEPPDTAAIVDAVRTMLAKESS